MTRLSNVDIAMIAGAESQKNRQFFLNERKFKFTFFLMLDIVYCRFWLLIYWFALWKGINSYEKGF